MFELFLGIWRISCPCYSISEIQLIWYNSNWRILSNYRSSQHQSGIHWRSPVDNNYLFLHLFNDSQNHVLCWNIFWKEVVICNGKLIHERYCSPMLKLANRIHDIQKEQQIFKINPKAKSTNKKQNKPIKFSCFISRNNKII